MRFLFLSQRFQQDICNIAEDLSDKFKFYIEGTKSPSMFEMVSDIIMNNPHAKGLVRGMNS